MSMENRQVDVLIKEVQQNILMKAWGILQRNGWIQEILPLNCTLRKASCILFLCLLLSEKTELNCLITRFASFAMYVSYRK